ncbi:MAG: glycosyltransferase family 4 protein [Firmicutes bacterium]|nr:glycosyltransferase family 4 protein [Bacillota bacterium]
MGKKICHITSVHRRYDVRIFIKQCQSLAKNGYDVTLLVNDEKNDETLEGVKIISTKYKPKNRIDRFIYSSKKMFNKAIEIDADIYQLHDPDLLPLGNKLKKLGKKVIFDSHEDVPQQIKDKQWIPKLFRNAISKFYESYEKNTVKQYDAVISVTPHLVERFKKINLNASLVTNYPIVDKDEIIIKKSERAICFAGGITEQWSHHNILKALKNIDNIKYILAGSATNDYLKLLKEMPAWQSVEYKGVIPHQEVKNVYLRSIAGMALNNSSQAKGQGTLGNTKLFEFMEAKLPVICTDYLLWKEIINEYKCGICVNPDNVAEIKEAIEYIINNPKEAEQMGENGRRAVLEKFNWGTQEKVLLEIYEVLSLD